MSPQTLIPSRSRTTSAKAGRTQVDGSRRQSSRSKRSGQTGRDAGLSEGMSSLCGRIRLRGRRGSR